MATQSVTKEVGFGFIPACDANTFTVRAGINSGFALGDADCLDSAVRALLQDAVSADGMDVDIAWLCRFAMNASCALRQAADAVG